MRVHRLPTSDRPAVERAKAANVATAVAEYFRDQGLSVLLLVDSVTRYARALREIGLAAGEPPTRRGYPPSRSRRCLVCSSEQANRRPAPSRRSIPYWSMTTKAAIPIGEEVRATLDGHIVLSNKLAGAGHYPAIDVLASRSRVMRQVVDESHRELARTSATSSPSTTRFKCWCRSVNTAPAPMRKPIGRCAVVTRSCASCDRTCSIKRPFKRPCCKCARRWTDDRSAATAVVRA